MARGKVHFCGQYATGRLVLYFDLGAHAQCSQFQVENFPSQDEVRAVMVEHALQGEDRSSSIIDFIASGMLIALPVRIINYSYLALFQIRHWLVLREIGSAINCWKLALMNNARKRVSEVFPGAGR